MDIEIVVPTGMFGPGKYYLVDAIIRAIAEAFSTEGEWADKYGVNVETPIFSMHKFCWCDSENCPWCAEDPAPHFHYKPTDFKVSWYKYIGRGMEMNRQVSAQECAEILSACLALAPKKS